MKHCICTIFAGCVLALAAGSAAGQTGARSIAPSTGKAMCSALMPADFTKAGVPVQSLSQANLDGNDGAYCVYQSKAGKVEFDIFFLAGKTPQEISGTEKTASGMAVMALPRRQTIIPVLPSWMRSTAFTP